MRINGGFTRQVYEQTASHARDQSPVEHFFFLFLVRYVSKQHLMTAMTWISRWRPFPPPLFLSVKKTGTSGTTKGRSEGKKTERTKEEGVYYVALTTPKTAHHGPADLPRSRSFFLSQNVTLTPRLTSLKRNVNRDFYFFFTCTIQFLFHIGHASQSCRARSLVKGRLRADSLWNSISSQPKRNNAGWIH